MRLIRLLWSEQAHKYLFNVMVHMVSNDMKNFYRRNGNYIGCVEYNDGTYCDVYYSLGQFYGIDVNLDE